MDDSHIAQLAALANNQIPSQEYQQEQHESTPEGPGTKRKAEDGGPSQQRAKRNRYISIACNECKRRKIKCNGQTPCQRCGNLNLECVYSPNCCTGFKDSQEYKDMAAHIGSLQEQVNTLYHEMSSLRAQIGGSLQPDQQHQQTPIDPSLQSAPYPRSHSRERSQSASQQQGFRGPTSNAFNFGVANNSLQTMGITSQNEPGEDDSTGDGPGDRESSPPGPLERRIGTQPPVVETHAGKDPIWSVTKEEAVRLCRIYDDEMGLMYPILDVEKIIAYANRLYEFMEAAQRTGLMQHGKPGADALDDAETNILKLVLATAMTVEASGRSELGRRMFEYVQPAIDHTLLGRVGVKGIRLLTMAAMYEFHRDDEGTSWRIIGLTARLCIELGLHRRETYEAMPENERTETILLFWAVYVLDRRWSFGTGMPFALQDADIDPLMPKPEEHSPYLSVMIQFASIGARVWRAVVSTPSPSVGGVLMNIDEMGYLDYQVVQWHHNLPADLYFEHPFNGSRGHSLPGPPSSRACHRLRIILYLRANQMRIHIYRSVLHSATSIMQHREQAQTVVNVAKDTVRILTHVNQTSDLYRTQQVLFNAFLTAALAVLFLAVSHTPAIFAETVREEFHMALDLVRGMSKGSWVSKRLWTTIRVLKEVGPKLGLANREHSSDKPMLPRAQTQQQQQTHTPAASNSDVDPSRSAAVAMAGLAGHNVDELALYSGQPHRAWSAATGASSSPENMANDLTSLFEAAGGFLEGQAIGAKGWYQGGGAVGESGRGSGVVGAENGQMGGENGMANVFGGDEGLSNILKELF